MFPLLNNSKSKERLTSPETRGGSFHENPIRILLRNCVWRIDNAVDLLAQDDMRREAAKRQDALKSQGGTYEHPEMKKYQVPTAALIPEEEPALEQPEAPTAEQQGIEAIRERVAMHAAPTPKGFQNVN